MQNCYRWGRARHIALILAGLFVPAMADSVQAQVRYAAPAASHHRPVSDASRHVRMIAAIGFQDLNAHGQFPGPLELSWAASHNRSSGTELTSVASAVSRETLMYLLRNGSADIADTRPMTYALAVLYETLLKNSATTMLENDVSITITLTPEQAVDSTTVYLDICSFIDPTFADFALSLSNEPATRPQSELTVASDNP